MKSGPAPVKQAAGRILGHNIAGPDGRRALRKGKQRTDAKKLTPLQESRIVA